MVFFYLFINCCLDNILHPINDKHIGNIWLKTMFIEAEQLLQVSASICIYHSRVLFLVGLLYHQNVCMCSYFKPILNSMGSQ